MCIKIEPYIFLNNSFEMEKYRFSVPDAGHFKYAENNAVNIASLPGKNWQ